MKKKKRRIRWNNVFLFLIVLICIIFCIISLKNLFKWLNDNKKSNNNLDKIKEVTEVKEVEDSNNTEIFINEDDPYWKYTTMNLIDIDFNELKKINKNTIGWIQVNGTNVNYPFVQTDNNDFYLTHSFNGSYNSAGWVFMDYRNDSTNFDKNTIIYAHGRYDNSMFGSLRNTIKNNWLNNDQNYIIKLSTLHENTLWLIFSIYVIPDTNDYLKIEFNSNQDFLDFTDKLKNRSKHNFNTSLNENDKILTLSTCYNNTDKIVLHAKLIKREKK